MFVRVIDWIDGRTGIRALTAAALDEPIPGGARWAYVFGSALLTVLLLQFGTGVLLTFYYVPSVDHAHTTVSYIQKEIPLGWLVRGVHYYGASATIVVLMLHLGQVFLWGAYKERREALWLIGVILLNLVLGFGFTGYLLPWDQKAYFGTQVAGGIAGSIPVLGDMISRLLLGGAGIGQATLSRFFAVHVFVLPVATILLIGAHLYLFRFRGPAGPASDDAASRTRIERFYPGQLFKDTVAALALAGALVALAAYSPALLGPKADPSASFVPRPEWYFLWTFQLLKVMPAFAGGVVVPGILMTALALAPFVDRGPARSFRARLFPNAVFLAVMTAIGALTAVAYFDDLGNPRIRMQEEAAREFMAEPFAPDRIGERPIAVRKPPPEVYAQNCAACHGMAGEGVIGPRLTGISSKADRKQDDLVRLLADPRAFGLNAQMPAFATMPEADRRAIAAWLGQLKD